MSRFILILSGLGLIMMFQNCQKTVSFGSGEGALKASGELTEVVLEDDAAIDDIVGEIPSTVAEESKHPKGPEDSSATPSHPEKEAGAGGYVCILDGPGKSVKLGLAADGSLQGQNSIPSVICMSEEACREIVSKKFTVKGPEARGYCKASGNPHVIHLSDEEIAAK